MLSELTVLLDTCAGKYRQGHEAEASTVLQQFVSVFSEKVAIKPAMLTLATERSVAAALGYQESQDWIALADELQYVLKLEIEKSEW